MRGSDVAILVEFSPVILETTDAWMDTQKNNLLSHILTMRESDEASLLEFHPEA